MPDSEQPRLRLLFPRIEVLPVPTRRRLAELLAVPGASPALLSEEILALPLPAAPDDQASVRQAIQAGLDRGSLAHLAELQVGEVVPAIEGRDGFIGTLPCSPRLRAVLQRSGVASWAELAKRRLDEIGQWVNVGQGTLSELVGLAVAAGMEFLAVRAPTAESPTSGACPDLVTLLDYERSAGGVGLRRLLESFAAAQHPEPVRAAAGRLLATPDPALEPHLAELSRALEATGDHRTRGIFEHRSLRLDDAAGMGDLAAALGISASRIRAICAEAEGRTRTAVDEAPGDLAEVVARLREGLGRVAPRNALDELLLAWRLPPLPDPRSLLLLWLAGPYRPVSRDPSWLAVEPAPLAADCRRMLEEDGGVRPVEQVRTDLQHLAISTEHVDAWLSVQEAVVLDNLVVSVSGPLTDVAERVFSATGRAMTAGELAAAISPGRQGATSADLERRLCHDRRFLLVGPERLELADWGGDAYDAAERFPPAPAPPSGRSWLRIEVDRSLLSGSSAPVPVPLVEALGVAPGARRTFATRYGPVAISHDRPQPRHGSLRPVALAAGASAGDALLFGFDPAEDGASVELVPSPAATALPL